MSENVKYYRIDLEKYEFEELKTLIGYIREYAKEYQEKTEQELYIYDDLLEKLENPKKIHYDKRFISTSKATEIRMKRVKEKIVNAINLLRLEGKKITAYAVSKTSGVCYQTVKKYFDQEEFKSLVKAN